MERRPRAWAGAGITLVLAGALWVFVRSAELTRTTTSPPPARLHASNGNEATPDEPRPPASGASSPNDIGARASLEPESRPSTPLARAKANEVVLGAIHGQVVDTQGRPVPGARVDIEELRLVVDADASGRFELLDLEPDDYRLTVLTEGLPRGLAPPSSTCRPHSTEIEIPETGGVVEVVLGLAEFATVTGRVLGPDGEPGRGFALHLTSLGPKDSAVRGWTDGEGHFHLWLWPSAWVLDVSARAAPEAEALPRPKRWFQLESGQVLDLGDIAFERGPCALLGHVIDQDGRPLEGIAIVCEGAATTGTRADGSFQFEGLFPQRYAVLVGPSGYPGYRRIFARKGWWLTLQADLAAGPPVLDLGEIQVVRDRLFAVRGRIEADPSVHPLDELQLRVEGLPPRSYTPPQPERIAIDRADGKFEYWFHPQEGPCELTFVVTFRRDDVARIPVRAVADDVVQIVIPVR